MHSLETKYKRQLSLASKTPFNYDQETPLVSNFPRMFIQHKISTLDQGANPFHILELDLQRLVYHQLHNHKTVY